MLRVWPRCVGVRAGQHISGAWAGGEGVWRVGGIGSAAAAAVAAGSAGMSTRNKDDKHYGAH